MAVRMCLGCRERAEQATLVRLVAVADHSSGLMVWSITPDRRRSLPGRGAYVHPDSRCLEAAWRRRVFGRALRVEGALDLGPVERLLAGTDG